MPVEEQADDIEQRFFSEADLLFVLVGDRHQPCNYVVRCPLANLDSLVPNCIFLHDQVSDVEDQAKAVVAISGPLLFEIFFSFPSLSCAFCPSRSLDALLHALLGQRVGLLSQRQ